MEKNEIKKVLYKEKPLATKQHHNELYDTETLMWTYIAISSLGVHRFDVPVSEMGENPFEKEIAAQLLIRWLV